MRSSLLLGATLLSLVASAQTTVTISTAPTNSEQVWYSLQNGTIQSAPQSEWDLAFEINSFNSSILVNTAKGMTAFETSVAPSDWAALTELDVENWTALYNAEDDWSAGALTNGNNLAEPDGFNLGWGTYNMVTHTVVGTKVYVFGLADGGYKKFRMNALATGAYSYTYADLDGSNEITGSLLKSAFGGKNFGYFSFETDATFDREPVATDWDLQFTKYTSIINAPEPTAYSVAGVLQNKNVLALQVDGVDPELAEWASAPMDSSINIIGYDWKTFNNSTFQYEYPVDRTYFVQDINGNIWKLIFTVYGGSATGEMTFTQELVSGVGVQEQNAVELVLYPNPATGGQLTMVLGDEVRKGQLSIMDMSGKLVKQQQVNSSAGLSAVAVDIAGIEQGLYMVQLNGEGFTMSSRVVIN